MTDAERRAALEAIAAEVRVCTRCRLHETRTQAVPGEGDPDTEVVFVGEGPGFNEDRAGPAVRRPRRRPARRAARLDRLAARRRLHHQRRQVPAARTTATREPDEIAACAPYLHRQLEVARPGRRRDARPLLDGARSCPARGSAQAHGTTARSIRRPAPATRSCSRCTTRPPRCGSRPSSARATRTSPASRRAARARAAPAPRARRRRAADGADAAGDPPSAAAAGAAEPRPTRRRRGTDAGPPTDDPTRN